MKTMKRSGIALLITLFFIMAITVAVGVSLTQFKEGRTHLDKQRFMVQCSAVLSDVVSLLQTAPMINEVSDADSLKMLLDSGGLIPLEADGLQLLIRVKSARGTLNINTLAASEPFQQALNAYLLRYNVQDVTYLNDLLIDSMRGEQPSYRTELFYEKPWLYREGIADRRHFEQLLDYYVQTRFDESVKKVPWEALVHFGNSNTSGVDANYVSSELWKLMLPDIQDEKAQLLAEGLEVYRELKDLELGDEDIKRLGNYGIEFYKPVLGVELTVVQAEEEAKIIFEYTIDAKQVKVLSYVL